MLHPGVPDTSAQDRHADEQYHGCKQSIEFVVPACLLYESQLLTEVHDLIIKVKGHTQVDQGKNHRHEGRMQVIHPIESQDPRVKKSPN